MLTFAILMCFTSFILFHIFQIHLIISTNNAGLKENVLNYYSSNIRILNNRNIYLLFYNINTLKLFYFIFSYNLYLFVHSLTKQFQFAQKQKFLSCYDPSAGITCSLVGRNTFIENPKANCQRFVVKIYLVMAKNSVLILQAMSLSEVPELELKHPRLISSVVSPTTSKTILFVFYNTL